MFILIHQKSWKLVFKTCFLVHNIHWKLWGQVENFKWILFIRKIGVECAYLKKISNTQYPFSVLYLPKQIQIDIVYWKTGFKRKIYNVQIWIIIRFVLKKAKNSLHTTRICRRFQISDAKLYISNPISHFKSICKYYWYLVTNLLILSRKFKLNLVTFYVKVVLRN